MLLKLLLPTVVLILLVVSCERDRRGGIYRPFTFEELEAHLRSEFDLRDLSLTRLPDGHIEGDGLAQNGRNYRFEITQSATSRTLVAKWDGVKSPNPSERRWTVAFADYTQTYLLLAFGYLLWIGKVLHSHRRSGTDRKATESDRQHEAGKA